MTPAWTSVQWCTVDGPGGVDTGVLDRGDAQRLLSLISDLFAMLPEPTQPKDTAHERRRVDGNDMGTGLCREHGARAHACADVEDSLIGAEIEQRDHRSVDR